MNVFAAVNNPDASNNQPFTRSKIWAFLRLRSCLGVFAANARVVL